MDYRGKSTIRGIRNNNPGNIIITKIDWLGKISVKENTDKEFEQFTEIEYGIRALMRNVRTYVLTGRDTITKIIRSWSSTNRENYIAFVCQKMKLSPHEKVTLNKDFYFDFAKAVIEFECKLSGLLLITDAMLEKSYAMLDDRQEEAYNAPNKNGLWWVLLLVGFGLVLMPKLYRWYKLRKIRKIRKNRNNES